MRILERYTLRSYLGPLVWCLTIFVGLYLVMDLLGHLDEILRHRVPPGLILTYYGTMVPLVFVQVAPFACLMATLYALGNLNRHQELMAMRSAGIDPYHIVSPLLWMGLLVSVGVLLVNETLAPQAALTTHSIKVNQLERPSDPKKPHKILKTIQHLAAYGQGHTLLYAKSFDPVDKTMEGIVILQHGKNLRLLRKITAESALWTGSAWRFSNGTILQFDEKGMTVGRPVPFKAKLIQAGDRPEILAKSESQADFMNSQDLARYIERLQGAGGSTVRKLRVDLYAKTASAFSCLVLTLIGIPFAIQSVRGGTVLGLSLGLGLGLVFYAANAILIALGKGGWLPPMAAAWATPIVFSLFGIREAWRRLA
ncbi:MAG: LptF/LptG family permease [Candidatus Omnitrophica bacterium]|nr:LptF/LptG family permease [Candidatus Omnitrophota bacterium]